MTQHSLAQSSPTSDEPHTAGAPGRPGRRIKTTVAGVTLTVVALAGAVLVGTSWATPDAQAPLGGGGGDSATVRLAPASPGQATRPDTAWRGSASWDRPIRPIPTRVRMPTVGVDAPVVGVDVATSGELGIPDQPRTLGWWEQGASPDGPGAVVIAGHVDTAEDGPGALFHLANAQVGQSLTVETNLGPHRYVVTDVKRYAKADLPQLTFTTTGPSHLVLITCGGEFNTVTRQYADNIVVSATPA